MTNITQAALRRLALSSVAALAVGCSGGGGGGSAPSVPATQPPVGSPPQAATVQVTVVVPLARGTSSASQRKPQYVSPNTQGLIVSVSDANGLHSQGYTISATSAGCSTLSGGQLQCVFSVTAASGSDTFYAYTYDAGQGASGNPTSLAGSYTPSGKLLSETVAQGQTQTINPGTSNTITLTLAAVVATVTAAQGPSVISVSGNGGTTSQSAVFDGVDGDGNRIDQYVSSAAAGAYINAISIGLTENGGSGLTSATPSALSNATTDAVNATFSSNNASVQPASATASPYSATIKGNDAFGPGGFNSSSSYPSASSAAVTIAPLFLFSPAYATAQGGATTLYGIAAARPSGAVYSIATAAPAAGTNDCSAFSTSTSSAVVAASQVAAFTITATGTSPSNSSGSPVPCVFQVADGTGTVTSSRGFVSNGQSVIIVVPTPVGATPTPTPTATATASPSPTATPAVTPTPTPTPPASTIIVIPSAPPTTH